MSCRILIVEDEFFVALELESVVKEMGHHPVGVAADSRRALELAPQADVAFVDLNLADGATGIGLGRQFAARGVTVVFATANPSQLGNGVPGTLGVIAKPLDTEELRAAIRFAAAVHRRDHYPEEAPPLRLRLFDWPVAGAAQLTG